MKKEWRIKKVVVLVMCCVLLISQCRTVYAASYAATWEKWSMSSSDYAAMRSSGCRVTAFAKCLAENELNKCGNPDGLYEWGKKNGAFSGDIAENGSFGTLLMNYLKSINVSSKKYKYTLTGNKTTDCAKIMELINQGYNCFLAYTGHTVYIGRQASIAAGEPIIMDSDGVQRKYRTYSTHTFTNLNYFTIDSDPIPPIKFNKITVSNLTETTAKVKVEVTATASLLSTIGLQWGKTTELSETPLSWPAGSYLTFCEVAFDGSEGPKLSPGTTYYYRFFAKGKDGKVYYSDKSSFTTKGTASSQAKAAVDLNGFLDGKEVGSLKYYGTADIYINDVLVANDCADFCQWYPVGTKFEVKDIKANEGFEYKGVYKGQLSGYVSESQGIIYLSFETHVHTPIVDEGIAATCTKEGKTAGSHCSVCLAVIKAQQTIPATGHTAVTDPGTAATCTKEGKTAGSHCSTCFAVITAQQTIPATGHTVVIDPGTAATCIKEGKTAGSYCSVCNTILTEQKTIPQKEHTYDQGVVTKLATCTEAGEEIYTCTECLSRKKVTIAKTGHDYEDFAVAATLEQNGKTGKRCANCGTESILDIIYRPETITLSKTSFTYNEKKQRPTVTVKDVMGETVSSESYKVTYGGKGIEVGAYKVTVTFTGEYEGKKVLSYNIIPRTTKFKSLEGGSKKLIVKWQKKTVSGYEIAYSTGKNFLKSETKVQAVKNASTTSLKIKGLKAKQRYYVRIRTYKVIANKKYYSKWSSVLSATTRK